jgi:hypothetical protein
MLDGDRAQDAAVGAQRQSFLGFDRCLQAVGPVAVLGDAACHLVDQLDGRAAHDVLDVAPQQHLGVERVAHGRGQVQVLGGDQAAAFERSFDRERAAFGEEDVARVLVELEVRPALEPAHGGGEARQETGVLAGFRPSDHQWDARLVDQDRVRLIHDGGVQRARDFASDRRPPVHLVVETKAEAVAQVVEAGFLGGDVGDVPRVCLPSRGRRHSFLHHAHAETEPFVNRPHPCGVAPRQIVVEGEDVRSAPRERGEERGGDRRQRLAFASRHLGDGAAVKRETSQNLDVVEALAERAPRGLAREREAIYHPRVVRAIPELERAAVQLLVAGGLKLRLATADGGENLSIVRAHPCSDTSSPFNAPRRGGSGGRPC